MPARLSSRHRFHRLPRTRRRKQTLLAAAIAGLILLLAAASWQVAAGLNQAVPTPTPAYSSLWPTPLPTRTPTFARASATAVAAEARATLTTTVAATPTMPSGVLPRLSAAQMADVDRLLGTMTLRQKVGQMLMLGFAGGSPAAAMPVLQTYLPGSIVLVQNTTEASQTAELVTAMQYAISSEGAGIPAFFAIDHEGGAGQRLLTGVTYFPSAMAVGATHSPGLVRVAGAVAGKELKALGITMSLGPCLDVDNNPPSPAIGANQRAYSADPALVASLGRAYIEGLQSQGVMAVAKHFPGQGSAREDPQKALPSLRRDRAELDRGDLPPFRESVSLAGGVMTSHILFPEIDRAWPASLSPVFITRILREEMGYDRLVMTSDLGMPAIHSTYDPGVAAVQAVKAGSDILMVVGDTSRQARVFDALVSAAERNDIQMERIDSSVRRILRAKVQMGLLDGSLGLSSAAPLPAPDAVALQQIAEASVTLVRNQNGQVPLPAAQANRPLVISANVIPPGQSTGPVPPATPVPAARDAGTRLGQQIRQRRPLAREIVFDMSGDNSATMSGALAEAKDADLVIVGTFDAGPWQQELIRRLKQQGARPVVIGFGRPDELASLPPDITYIAAYNPRYDMVDAAVRILFGEIPAKGRLPVEVPGLYPTGHHASSASGTGGGPTPTPSSPRP